MDQGDIYLINLDPAIHTEIGKTRPGIILSINAMNQYSPRVIVAPITSNVKKVYPFEVLIPAESSALPKESKVMIDQLRSCDKRRLIKKLGTLNTGFKALRAGRTPACHASQTMVV